MRFLWSFCAILSIIFAKRLAIAEPEVREKYAQIDEAKLRSEIPSRMNMQRANLCYVSLNHWFNDPSRIASLVLLGFAP